MLLLRQYHLHQQLPGLGAPWQLTRPPHGSARSTTGSPEGPARLRQVHQGSIYNQWTSSRSPQAEHLPVPYTCTGMPWLTADSSSAYIDLPLGEFKENAHSLPAVLQLGLLGCEPAPNMTTPGVCTIIRRTSPLLAPRPARTVALNAVKTSPIPIRMQKTLLTFIFFPPFSVAR